MNYQEYLLKEAKGIDLHELKNGVDKLIKAGLMKKDSTTISIKDAKKLAKLSSPEVEAMAMAKMFNTIDKKHDIKVDKTNIVITKK